MPEINNLRGGKIYFGSWFQSMVVGRVILGPVMRPDFMEKVCSRVHSPLMSRKQREQESKRERIW
jgi:hypothetical protein